MVAEIQELGPLGIPKKFEEWDKEIEDLKQDIENKEKEEVAKQ